MKKLFVFSAILSAAFVSQTATSFAGSKTVTPTNRADCIKDANDPYDTGEVMRAGPNKGVCMNLALHRAVVLLGQDDNSIQVANFYHDGHFWTAQVPKTGIDRVIFQMASFVEPYPLIKFDHTQLRFILKPGVTVKLTAQDLDSTLPDSEISDFTLVDQVMSIDPSYSYDPVQGLKSAYGNVIRLVDSSDRAKEEVLGDSNKGTVVRQFVLKMNDEEKDALLLNGITLADKLGYNDIYKLFSENCTTVLFEVLDKSMTYDRKVRKFKIHFWNILDPIGGTSTRALDKRGLVDEEIETWNKELGMPNT